MKGKAGVRAGAHKSFSSAETKKLGEQFGANLRSQKTGATVLALSGDLGAGKTTFAQGFLKGLGARGRAVSPTFVIMRRHGIAKARSGFRNVFHIDAYRLKDPKALAMLGFKEILTDARNVVFIEWAEKVKKLLPKQTTWLKFEHGKKEHERRIIIESR